jgi:hypothetical protein
MKVWFPMAATGTGSEVFTHRLSQALMKSGFDTHITYYPKQIEAMPWLIAAMSIDMEFLRSLPGMARLKNQALTPIKAFYKSIITPLLCAQKRGAPSLAHRRLLR